MKKTDVSYSQQGSAIIMALLVFSLVGIASVYVMGMFKENNNALRRDARVDSYKSLVETVRANLYTGNNCTEMLANANLNRLNLNNAIFTRQNFPASGGGTVKLDVGGIKSRTDNLPIRINMGFNRVPGPLQAGWEINGGTKIREIRLKWQTSDLIKDNVQRDTPVSPRPALMKAVNGFLEIIPDHRGINPLLPRNDKFKIKLLMYFDRATGNLKSCFDPTGDAAFCTINGGVFNPEAGVLDQYRCEPDDGCWVWGSGIVTNTAQCPNTNPPRYKANMIGSLASPLYMCDWCNRHKTPSAGGSTTSGGGGGGGSYGGGGGGGGCFVAGTKITLAQDGYKNIEDVKTGDELLDSKGKVVKVTNLVSYKYKGPIYSINGGRHFFTPNHPFLTLDGWKSLDPAKSMKESPGLVVSMLREGDVLLKQGGMETVYVLDSIYSEEDVYNFTVTDSHEYIADEYFVHNLQNQIKQYQQY